MEIEKFIKIYDGEIDIKQIASLIKYANNKVKFEDAGIILENNNNKTDKGVRKNIRNTKVHSFTNADKNNLSSAHWGHYIRHIIRDKFFNKYDNEYPTTATSIKSVDLLKYEVGGFYKQHIDNHGKFPRTVSVIIFLNNDYEGGELNFHNPLTNEIYQTIKPAPGRCVMWPSNFMYPHSISPVTKGTRYSVVSWIA